jgi:hypothetical protein
MDAGSGAGTGTNGGGGVSGTKSIWSFWPWLVVLGIFATGEGIDALLQADYTDMLQGYFCALYLTGAGYIGTKWSDDDE